MFQDIANRGPCHRRPRRTAATIRFVIIATGFAMLALPALAGTEVQGQPTNMELRAENASTHEILNKLATKFNLTFKIPTNIGRQFTGLYSGTLQQVLGRILEGNHYIIRASEDSIEVVVLGASSSNGVASLVPNAAAGSDQPSITPVSLPVAAPVHLTNDNVVTAPVSPASRNHLPPLASFR